MTFSVAAGYLLVGMLWGCTNPIIKHAQANSIETAKSVEENSRTKVQHVFHNLKRLFLEPTVFLPYIINQMGSLVYYYVLSQEPVNRANPICNSLTFVITAITGYTFFGETFQHPFLTFAGILLVLVGIYICATS